MNYEEEINQIYFSSSKLVGFIAGMDRWLKDELQENDSEKIICSSHIGINMKYIRYYFRHIMFIYQMSPILFQISTYLQQFITAFNINVKCT